MSQLIYKLEHLSWERIISVCRYSTCCWLLSVCRIGAYILLPFMVHHESVDPQQGERGANLWLMGFCLCQECLPSSERGSEETQSRYLLLWCAHNEQTTEPGPRRSPKQFIKAFFFHPPSALFLRSSHPVVCHNKCIWSLHVNLCKHSPSRVPCIKREQRQQQQSHV